MTLLAIMALPFAAGAALATFTLWPIAHRAGKRAEQRDQAEIARILGGYDAPPVVRAPIEWRRPAPVVEIEPVRRTGPGVAAHGTQVLELYRPKHAAGQMVMAHLTAAADTFGRPRELVA